MLHLNNSTLQIPHIHLFIIGFIAHTQVTIENTRMVANEVIVWLKVYMSVIPIA